MYIVIEGIDGVGKTTQTELLVKHLLSKGNTVLHTKEPGTSHLPLTVQLRSIMLDQQYDSQLTPLAREYIAQAIRSIHLEKLIVPALEKYDYIVQDRGILSGFAYGDACGNTKDLLEDLTRHTCSVKYNRLYDLVIYLKGDPNAVLRRAVESKSEFIKGDVIENKGNIFMGRVAENMELYKSIFTTVTIDVDRCSIEEVHKKIINVLEKIEI